MRLFERAREQYESLRPIDKAYLAGVIVVGALAVAGMGAQIEDECIVTSPQQQEGSVQKEVIPCPEMNP